VPPAEDDAEVFGVPGEEHLPSRDVSWFLRSIFEGVGERGNDGIRSCCTLRALCARHGPCRYDPYVSDPLLLFEKLEIW